MTQHRPLAISLPLRRVRDVDTIAMAKQLLGQEGSAFSEALNGYANSAYICCSQRGTPEAVEAYQNSLTASLPL